jgi:sugar phosphate isomerase/epimerase
MIQLGIRLHDVNEKLSPEEKTLAARARKAREEGFSCVHLAPQKVLPGVPYGPEAMTEGLAMHFRRVFSEEKLDVAVLGCYLNLAHPDPAKLRDIQARYFGNIRMCAVMGAGMVGTETGCPNAEYKMDGNTRSKEALETFIRNLAPVAECAEQYGVTIAIEPVWGHIVWCPDRALEVIRAVQSPNLRIIYDPVNLLGPDNADEREEVFLEAQEKLGPYVAMVHLKDFVRKDGKLVSVAAGTGEMRYETILRYLKTEKPYIQATLENTSNENATASRAFIEKAYAAC